MHQIARVIFLLSVCMRCVAAPVPWLPHQFQQTLRYHGSNLVCQKVLGNTVFYEKYTSTFQPGKEGSVYLLLENPTGDLPPLYVLMSKDGDSDRYAFSDYHSPDLVLIVSQKKLGLYGEIFNLCLNGDRQSALLVDVPFFHDDPLLTVSCIVTTRHWNLCRY